MAGSADCRTSSPVSYDASMSWASWPVTTEVVSWLPAIALPCRAAERVPSMPMAATAITRSVPKSAIRRTVGALASVAFTST